MLGALSAAGGFPVSAEAIEESISISVPGAAGPNLAAFRTGRKHALDLLSNEARRKP
jgi:Pyruvate/2-oxoacid:ferredoxin oxidoreductase gamma subunit